MYHVHFSEMIVNICFVTAPEWLSSNKTSLLSFRFQNLNTYINRFPWGEISTGRIVR